MTSSWLLSKERYFEGFPPGSARHLRPEAGAISSGLSVTVDGRLVTAEHEHAADLWIENVLRVLRGEPVEELVFAASFKTRRQNRKTDPDVLRLRRQ